MNSTAPIDLCAIPAGTPPNGKFNLVNPPSLGPAIISVGIILATFSTAFAAGRLYINRKKLRAADYFTFVACIINITYTGIIVDQHRFYRHEWDIPVCWINGSYLRLPFVQTILFFPVFFFPKAAIFLLYRQLFAVGRNYRMLIDFGILITFLLYVSNVPLAALYAAPRAGHSWDSLLETLNKYSHPFSLAGAIQSAIATVMDFYAFFLPLPILFRLRMPSKRRWQLVGVFSTAVFGVAASVVSLVFKIKIVETTDASWLGGIASMTTLIEVNVAIIVGCMPAFAQIVTLHISGSSFFRTIRTRLMGSSSRGPPSKELSNEQVPKLNTFGSNQKPRQKDNYYEMSDTILLHTQSNPENNDSGTERDV